MPGQKKAPDRQTTKQPRETSMCGWDVHVGNYSGWRLALLRELYRAVDVHVPLRESDNDVIFLVHPVDAEDGALMLMPVGAMFAETVSRYFAILFELQAIEDKQERLCSGS